MMARNLLWGKYTFEDSQLYYRCLTAILYLCLPPFRTVCSFRLIRLKHWVLGLPRPCCLAPADGRLTPPRPTTLMKRGDRRDPENAKRKPFWSLFHSYQHRPLCKIKIPGCQNELPSKPLRPVQQSYFSYLLIALCACPNIVPF
jgi:hypothetical protein